VTTKDICTKIIKKFSGKADKLDLFPHLKIIRSRFEKFKISYGAADNYLCRLISAKC